MRPSSHSSSRASKKKIGLNLSFLASSSSDPARGGNSLLCLPITCGGAMPWVPGAFQTVIKVRTQFFLYDPRVTGALIFCLSIFLCLSLLLSFGNRIKRHEIDPTWRTVFIFYDWYEMSLESLYLAGDYDHASPGAGNQTLNLQGRYLWNQNGSWQVSNAVCPGSYF